MAMDQDEQLRVDPEERARRMRAARDDGGKWVLLACLVIAIAIAAGAAGYWWWSTQRPEPAATTAGPAAPPRAAAPLPSGPAYPVAPQPQSPMAAADVEPALVDLLGARAVASLLQAGDFPRRAAATIDNLGRDHAPSSVWPVQPTPGRFTVEDGPDGTVIAPANASRYAPFVQLATGVDTQRAVALYRRMYPLLQQAYRELGFGQRYLNDRLVEVIDQLLATPEPQRPPRVMLLEVKGPLPSLRPWVRYQYVDPKLEALTAGQKIMLRVGIDNERRLKRKLTEVRAQLVAAPQPVR